MELKRDIFLMDIIHDGCTNGVTKCIESIIENSNDTFNKIWIRFLVSDDKIDIESTKHRNYTKIIVPILYSDNNFDFEYIYEKISNLLTKNCILHLHTLNLIDLAELIKRDYKCKIITHLHCSPYRLIMDLDMNKYHEIRKQLLTNPMYKLTSLHELKLYQNSDLIICVSKNGEVLVKSIYPYAKTIVIENGSLDTYDSKNNTTSNNVIFVGHTSISKGTTLMLHIVRYIKNIGIDINLHIYGSCTSDFIDMLNNDFIDIKDNIKIYGVVKLDVLKELYKNLKVGIITSLLEQCSYVGIEMCMFGLPIVTTNCDGLDEMFTNNVDCLKCNINEDLVIDIEPFALKIALLLNDKQLADRLSKNARNTYETKYKLNIMIDKINLVYNSIY